MRIPRSLGFALSASATVAMLAGCSGVGQQTPSVPDQTQSQQSVARQGVNAAMPAASTLANISPSDADLSVGAGQNSATVPGGLYVAQGAARTAPVIREYALPDNKNGPPKCKDILPTSGVFGIGVNARHVLYVPVATFGKPSKILTFGPNCGKAGPRLDGLNDTVIDVAFDNTNDTVYVATDTGSIDVYEKEATLPTRTLHNDQLVSSPGVAVDSHGNVFQSGHKSANWSSPGLVDTRLSLSKMGGGVFSAKIETKSQSAADVHA